MDIGFVVHVHVFNVHRGSIAFRDYLKTGHDISQSSGNNNKAIIKLDKIKYSPI